MKCLIAVQILLVAFASLASSLPVNLVARTHRDTTWTSYSVGEGLVGACGFFIHKSAFGIALSSEKFQPTLCGRIISLKTGGKQAYAQVLDRCEDCGYADLKLTERLFTYFSKDTSTPLVGDWEFGN